MLVNKVFQNSVVVVDHGVGAFASIEVDLQALGHGEDIFGVVRFDEMFAFAVGSDDGDGNIIVTRHPMDSRKITGEVIFVQLPCYQVQL